MRRLLLLVLAALLLSASPAAAQDTAGSVVVVGIAGLRWDHVTDATPALQALAARSAVGSLSVKALPAVTCRADGWLTLGAGTRAEAYGGDRPCTDALPDDLEAQSRRNLASNDGADLAALVELLDGGVRAVGPGARLAVGQDPDGEAPAGIGFGPRLLLLDLGSADRLAELDRAVAEVVAQSEGSDLLVVGLSEGPGADEPRLHVAMASGPSFERGALRSASTRRDGVVQLIDVAPTVLDLLGEPVPDVMDGQPWTVSGAAPSFAALVDADRKASGQRSATVPFFVVLLAVPLLLVALLWRRPRVVELVALTATAALGASYLANLVPWWRTSVPLIGLLAVVVPLSLLVAAAALRASPIFAGVRPTRRGGRPHEEDRRPDSPGAGEAVARPARVVAGFVAVVLIADLLTGAQLQLSSVAGYSPLVAGRFAGIGNVAFGVLAASVLLAVSGSRRATTVAVVGLVAVVVDGAPPFGSDVGGVLALVPAFVLLAMLRTGTRVTLGRLALAGGAAAAVVTAFALADWSRAPQDRTHLGRFVEDVVDGTAGEVLSRKAEAVFALLFRSPVTAALVLVVAAAISLVVKPPAPLRRAFDTAPGWRHGLTAVGLASALGFALNDSGAAVPALAVCVALPATLAVVARARRTDAAPAPL